MRETLHESLACRSLCKMTINEGKAANMNGGNVKSIHSMPMLSVLSTGLHSCIAKVQ